MRRRAFGLSPAERRTGLDSLNLFFGALLGANLGTFDRLPLIGYIQAVALLAGSVIAIQLAVGTTDRRRSLTTLAVYALLVGSAAAFPELRPRGVDADDFRRVVTTLIIWLGLAMFTRFGPNPGEDQPAVADPDAPR